MNNYLKYGLHAAVLIGLGIAGFKYLSGEGIWSAIRSFDYVYMPFILLIATLYFVLKAWRFHILLTPFADVKRGTVMRAYAAGQAATLVPGGIAARVGLLKQAEVPVEDSSVPVAFSSIADQTVFIAGALLAAIFFEPARMPAYIILGVLVVVGLLLFIPAVRGGLMSAAEWVTGKFGYKEQLHDFLENVTDLLNPSTILWTLGLTVASVVLEIVALDLTVRGVGESISYATLALAYVLPTMLGRLSGLPAGLGVTEAGMLGFLTSFSPLGIGAATAATVIFRIATAFFRALLGAVVYVVAWQGDEEDATAGA